LLNSYLRVNLKALSPISEVKQMETLSSKVTSKGQIVIPQRLREKYRIRALTAIRWIEKDQGLLMVPESEGPVKAARGMLKGSGILKAYLKEINFEKQRENRRVERIE
jgi:bifunctional DNA-binding transcriptional regulator/antitoxin component of YhaV-PrlF toxin-antitoxin module